MAEEVVTYQLGANIDDLKRALGEAEKSVSQLASTIERGLTQGGQRGAQSIGNSIRSSQSDASRAAGLLGNVVGRTLGTAIGAGIGAVLSGAAIKAAVSDVIKQANLAQDTRLSTSTIAGLEIAGKKNGVSPDEIQSALEKFTEVSKKAKDDAESFYKALGNIGPGFVKAFETAPTQSERLRILSDALRSTTDEVKKAQLSQEAFGSDSERLISALGAGRDALQAYEQAARALGLAADDALVSKAQQADRTISNLATVIQTNLRAALVELGPVLANIAASLGQFAEAASRAIAAIGGVRFATNSILKEKLDQSDTRLEALNLNRNYEANRPRRPSDFLVPGRRASDVANIDAEIASERARRLEALTELSRRGEYADPRDLRARADTEGALRAANAGNRFGSFKPRASLSGGSGGGGSSGLSDADRAENRLEKYTEQLQRQGEVLKAEIDTFGQSNAERKAAVEIAKAQVDLQKVDEDTRTRLTEAITAQVKVNEEYRTTLERQKDAMSAARSVGQELSDALGDIVLDGKNASDAMKNLLKSFARQALNAAFAGSGAFAGLFGTKESGGIFGSLFKGLFGGLFGRAGGGELPRGYTMVGENGPELLRNNGSGVARVYPHGGGSSGMSGGGGSIVINADFRGASDSAVAQIRAQLNAMQQNLPKQISAANRRQQVRGYA
ncbi:hypothetical protein [Sphingomonas daechungensis]|uniref:hypothetical protein n=1 Tax=Sphingomonas daechungensis TaxID=1176646 RepID=UPI0037848E3A